MSVVVTAPFSNPLSSASRGFPAYEATLALPRGKVVFTGTGRVELDAQDAPDREAEVLGWVRDGRVEVAVDDREFVEARSFWFLRRHDGPVPLIGSEARFLRELLTMGLITPGGGL